VVVDVSRVESGSGLWEKEMSAESINPPKCCIFRENKGLKKAIREHPQKALIKLGPSSSNTFIRIRINLRAQSPRSPLKSLVTKEYPIQTRHGTVPAHRAPHPTKNKIKQRGRKMSFGTTGTISSLSGCVSSLRNSTRLLDSSISILDSGIQDFPRMKKVLQCTRVSCSPDCANHYLR